MRIGVILPQLEIGSDPAAIRAYAETAAAVGFRHILAYDHVLGADPSHRPGWTGYTSASLFHEPFVLFGYLAAVVPEMELVTGVIILPQRQTVLVAKQAAEVDLLTGGHFRLGIGVGWNRVEYEALGEDFTNRGRRSEEQIALLRTLWTEPVVTFNGTYHQVHAAGLNPLPVQRPIPIWLGGDSDAAMRRAGKLADGWIPHGRPDTALAARINQVQDYAEAAGRVATSVQIEGRLSIAEMAESDWREETERWRELGVSHLGINTMGAGLASPSDHRRVLERFAALVPMVGSQSPIVSKSSSDSASEDR